MILRAARPADATAVCAIINPIIRDTTITFTTIQRTADNVAADIAARGAAFLVAELGGGIAGYATYGTFRGGPGYAATREHSVHLASGARGQGLGRALLTSLEDVARASGVHVLVGGISATNAKGLAFHRHMGFSEVARMPQVGHKNGRWLDLVLVQKILTGDSAPDSAAHAG